MCFFYETQRRFIALLLPFVALKESQDKLSFVQSRHLHPFLAESRIDKEGRSDKPEICHHSSFNGERKVGEAQKPCLSLLFLCCVSGGREAHNSQARLVTSERWHLKSDTHARHVWWNSNCVQWHQTHLWTSMLVTGLTSVMSPSTWKKSKFKAHNSQERGGQD